MKTMTFNDLRKIKDDLPEGSIRRIAEDLQLSKDTVKNYFGGINDGAGYGSGIHVEPGGANGGIVTLDDPTILERALVILGEETYNIATD